MEKGAEGVDGSWFVVSSGSGNHMETGLFLPDPRLKHAGMTILNFPGNPVTWQLVTTFDF